MLGYCKYFCCEHWGACIFSKLEFSLDICLWVGLLDHMATLEHMAEIKLPTSAGSLKRQESSRKTTISALLTVPKPLTVWITINCGKFWKRWEYQTTWPASWEICMQVKKQQLELDMEQQTGCILSPCLFNFYAEYIMRNTGLEEAQVGIKIAGRNINNLRYAVDTTLRKCQKNHP